MKIAIICTYDFSIAWSLEKFVKKLLLTNEVTIISDIHDGFKPGYYLNIMLKWGVKHEYVKAYRFINPVGDIKYFLNLYKIINKGKYDMVINIATKPIIFGTIAARLAHLDNIVCFSWGLGLVFEKTKVVRNIILKYILNTLYKYCFSVSRKVWFTNKIDIKYFLKKKIIIPQKIILTKGWIDTVKYSPTCVTEIVSENLRKELKYSKNDKIVISIIRLSWAKGIRQFCEASDILRDKFPNVKFLLVGQKDTGSPDRVPDDYIKRYQEYKNFAWIGYRIDIKELYSIAYLAVFPSYYRESGWPAGIKEPMAMGKPVITTDSVHCSCAIDDRVDGFIFRSRDSIALAKIIKEITLDHKLASEIGVEAREKAVKQFDEKIIMNQVIKAIL